jgi:hypothetical protein
LTQASGKSSPDSGANCVVIGSTRIEPLSRAAPQLRRPGRLGHRRPRGTRRGRRSRTGLRWWHRPIIASGPSAVMGTNSPSDTAAGFVRFQARSRHPPAMAGTRNHGGPPTAPSYGLGVAYSATFGSPWCNTPAVCIVSMTSSLSIVGSSASATRRLSSWARAII